MRIREIRTPHRLKAGLQTQTPNLAHPPALHKRLGGASFKGMSATRPNPVRMLSHALAALFNSRLAFLAEWRRYGTLKTSSQGIEGRWVGEWISESNGHRGELKCVLAPLSTMNYRAYFYGTFAKIFRVAYATELKVEQIDGRTLVKGEEDLGALAGGVYRCEGEVVGNELKCHYSCKYDHGTFRLERWRDGVME